MEGTIINFSIYLKIHSFKFLQAEHCINCVVMQIFNDLKLILKYMVTIIFPWSYFTI